MPKSAENDQAGKAFNEAVEAKPDKGDRVGNSTQHNGDHPFKDIVKHRNVFEVNRSIDLISPLRFDDRHKHGKIILLSTEEHRLGISGHFTCYKHRSDHLLTTAESSLTMSL